MSEADASDQRETTTSDGVTVKKSFEADEFPVPAVAFEITSERDEAVRVRITDEIPDEVRIDDLGFHPEYGSEHWTVEEDAVVFERVFDPDEQYITVYGIRSTDAEDVDRFLGKPRVDVEAADEDEPSTEGAGATGAETGEEEEAETAEEEAETGEEEADTVEDEVEAEPPAGDAAEADAADEEPAAEESDATGAETPGADEESAAASSASSGSTAAITEESETPEERAEPGEAAGQDVGDPDAVDADEAGTATGGATAGAAAGSGAVAAAGDRSVAAALADEIREGSVEEDDLQVLRDNLELTDSSTDVRIRHLQTQVSDLEAYSEALEEFIDENGPARELLTDLREEVGELDSRLADVDGRTESNAADIDSLDDEVESVEDRVEEAHEDLTDQIAGVDDDVTGRVDELEDQYDQRMVDLEEDVDEIQTEIDDLESDLEDLETRMEERMEERIETRIEDLREDVSELESWRSQVASVFGGGAPGGGGSEES